MRADHEVAQLKRAIVPVVRLDTFCKENTIGEVNLLKVDTETTEDAVIAGMGDTLARHRPHIICEVLPHSRTSTSIQRLLAPLGYRYYLLTDNGPVEKTEIATTQQWHNYLFTTLDARHLAELLT
jgi:hypothetical protein